MEAIHYLNSNRINKHIPEGTRVFRDGRTVKRTHYMSTLHYVRTEAGVWLTEPWKALSASRGSLAGPAAKPAVGTSVTLRERRGPLRGIATVIPAPVSPPADFVWFQYPDGTVWAAPASSLVAPPLAPPVVDSSHLTPSTP